MQKILNRVSQINTLLHMKKLLILSLALLTFFGAYGQKKNPYHTPGTKEYTEVTSKLLGTWNIQSFSKQGDEKIGTTYAKATVEFQEFDSKGRNSIATFRFTLPQKTVEERIESWNKKETTLVVDQYVVVATVEYKISPKGVLVYCENQMNHPEITGSGSQLENFIGTETAFISSQSAMKQSGGLGNLATAQLLKSVSGTNFAPSIPTQINYKNLTDDSVEFIGLQKLSIKLTK